PRAALSGVRARAAKPGARADQNMEGSGAGQGPRAALSGVRARAAKPGARADQNMEGSGAGQGPRAALSGVRARAAKPGARADQNMEGSGAGQGPRAALSGVRARAAKPGARAHQLMSLFGDPVRIADSMELLFSMSAAAADENRALAQALRVRDPEVLDRLIEEYQYRLLRYLVSLTGARALAEDLFQETWIRVLERGRQYDPRYRFEPWLFAIARNL